ncbi:hypothetical protein M5689_006756 [Euphorbia peplus]|nr:hypothetical protein M5689_006756 [Euphorbia peplus]
MLTSVLRRRLLSSSSSFDGILMGSICGLHTAASSKEEVVASFHHLLRLMESENSLEHEWECRKTPSMGYGEIRNGNSSEALFQQQNAVKIGILTKVLSNLQI